MSELINRHNDGLTLEKIRAVQAKIESNDVSDCAVDSVNAQRQEQYFKLINK